MKQQRRNKIVTFFWSFLPGAAEMYMGFMKQGLSLMTVFFLCFIIPTVLRVSDVFILFGGLVWFYGFFHARNVYACDDETFENLKDEYIWNEFLAGRVLTVPGKAVRKWGAVVLIITGVTILWNNLADVIFAFMPRELWDTWWAIADRIPQSMIALLIIGLGLHMIRGKKEALDGEGK